jgi:hypothetical protein
LECSWAHKGSADTEEFAERRSERILLLEQFDVLADVFARDSLFGEAYEPEAGDVSGPLREGDPGALGGYLAACAAYL